MEWEMEHRPDLLADRAEMLTAEVIKVELINEVLLEMVSGFSSSSKGVDISQGEERRK